MSYSYQYARRRGRVVTGNNPFKRRYVKTENVWGPPRVSTAEEYIDMYYPHLLDEFMSCRKRESPHLVPSEQLNNAFTWSDSPSGHQVWSDIRSELRKQGQ